MLHHGGVMSWAQMDEKDNLGSLIDQTLTRIPNILENRSMRSFCSGAGTCWDCVKDKGRPPFMGNYSLSFKMCLENCTHHYCFSTIPTHPFPVSRPPMPRFPFKVMTFIFFIIINNNCYYLREWVNARPHPTEALLAVNSSQEKENLSSLRMCPLLGLPCSGVWLNAHEPTQRGTWRWDRH